MRIKPLKPFYIRSTKSWRQRFIGLREPISISIKQMERGWDRTIMTTNGKITLTFEATPIPEKTKEGSDWAAKLWAESVENQLRPNATIITTQIIKRLQQEIRRLKNELDGSWAANPEGYEQTIGEIEDLETEIDIQKVAQQQGIDLNKERKEKRELRKLFINNDDDDEPPTEVEDHLYFQQLKKKPDPDNKLIAFWHQRFLELEQKGKQRSPGGWKNLERNLQAFIDYVRPTSNVEKINEDLWDSFVLYVKKTYGQAKGKDVLGISKKFIKFCYKRDLIDLPKNLDDYGITIDDKDDDEIEHFEPKELKTILETSTGILKCFLFLMANCGFTQIDIATLNPAMLKDGYIVRRRHKQRDGQKLPIVHWKLWPETIDLINQYRTDKNGLLFTREDGSTWYRDEIMDGKQSKDDRISALWDDFFIKNPQRLTPKFIRKTAAQYLTPHNISIQTKFLGHKKPKGITAAKHYVKVEQKDLDRSIMGLRKRLLAPTPTKKPTTKKPTTKKPTTTNKIP